MLITKNPTSNTSPDPSGGSAVNSPTNTGHATTTSTAVGDGIGVTEIKSCLWSGFDVVSGAIISKTLKITHTSDGTRSGASAVNQFSLDYSLNGGGAWISAVSRINMTSLSGPTVFSVALPIGQDLSQVRVRDAIQASALTVAHSATATAAISDIKIEVLLQDGSVVVFGF